MRINYVMDANFTILSNHHQVMVLWDDAQEKIQSLARGFVVVVYLCNT
jgi:hypothetical protein